MCHLSSEETQTAYIYKLKSPIFSSCCILRKDDTQKIKNLKGKYMSPRSVEYITVFRGDLQKTPSVHRHLYLAFTKPDILRLDFLFFVMFLKNSFISFQNIKKMP